MNRQRVRTYVGVSPRKTPLGAEQLEARFCLAAAMPVFLGDLNTTPVSPDVGDFIPAEDFVYFTAHDAVHGGELWQVALNGDAVPRVIDLNPGPESSRPTELRTIGAKLLFLAENRQYGRELWLSDGSPSGPHVVTDLRREITMDALPTEFAQVGLWTYFIADDGLHGRQVWRTDGSVGGTHPVTELAARNVEGVATELHVASDTLLIITEGTGGAISLWTLDDAGSVKQVINAESPQSEILGPSEFVVAGDSVYFTAQVGAARELFQLGVTNGGNMAVRLTSSGSPSDLIAVGDRLYFAADSESGRELWQTDGTVAGTRLRVDINRTDSVAASASQFVKIGNRIYFTATNAAHGTELWVSDGTTEGTHLFLDMQPGPGSSSPRELTEFQGKLVFSAEAVSNQLGRELWVSDGTLEGTQTIRSTSSSDFPTDPQQLVVAGETLFFFAELLGSGRELWTSNGTSQGTSQLRDIAPGDANSIFASDQLVAVGSSVYFVAQDPDHGRELWTSDGTRRGTRLVLDARPGSDGSIATDAARHKLVTDGTKVYFAADSDGRAGAEIWVTDGTEAGTLMVQDPGRPNQHPLPLDVADGWLYFASAAGGNGTELWRTNGTPVGTVQVADLSRGPASTIFFPHGHFTPFRPGQFLFPAVTAGGGSELWVTNGTPLGTSPIDLEPGSGHTRFGDLVQIQVVNGLAYYFATSPSRGRGLWRTNGTLNGTQLIAQGDLQPWPDLTRIDETLYFGNTNPQGNLAQYTGGTLTRIPLVTPDPASSSDPHAMFASATELYFAADDGVYGTELWASDGTPDGTRLLADVAPGGLGSDPQEIALLGDRLYFSAMVATSGRELWSVSLLGDDPQLVADVVPGPGSSHPTQLQSWGSKLLFSVMDASGAPVLWISDGSQAGTHPLFESLGEQFRWATDVLVDDDRLYLRAPAEGTILGEAGEGLGEAGEGKDPQMWLWRVDGPTSPPIPIATVDVQPSITLLDHNVYFAARHPKLGVEPWMSDGSAEGTRMLADVNATTPGSQPSSLVVQGEFAFFLADDGAGRQLWQTDGTEPGTRSVSAATPSWDGTHIVAMLPAADGLFVTLERGEMTEIWKLVPEASPATLLWSDTDVQRFAEVVEVAGNELYFLANTSEFGTELWVTGESIEATRLVRDINPGADSTDISSWTPFQNGHVFVADEPTRGQELWFTDGTETGTFAIADINPGPAGSAIAQIFVEDDRFYFAANDGVHGLEPWVSDGTAAGTHLLVNLDTRTDGSNPTDITVAGPNVFFAATTALGTRLYRWRPDVDVPPELVSNAVSDPGSIVAVGSGIYFSGYTPDTGRELWYSDGTAAGTRMIADVLPGEDGSSPEAISVMENGDVYFSAVDAAHGRDAWWLPALAGDANGDWRVDFADFLTLSSRYGQTGTWRDGDFDHDGLVGFGDFLILSNQYGQT